MKKSVIISIIFILVFTIFSSIAAQAATVYYVRSGDSLWKIASKFNVTMDMLSSSNNIGKNEHLYIGQKLIIKNKADNIYYVKSGDTLWEIAQNYNVTVEEILETNQLDNYNIYVGQKLYLNKKNEKHDDNRSNANYNQKYIYYTIKSGDILWNIAQKYGVTVKKLVYLNHINDAYDLYIGRRLIIPVNKSEKIEENTTQSGSINNPYYFYRVKENEKIWSIADNFGVRVSEILNYNDISNINTIETGTLVVIPLKESNKLSYIKKYASHLNNNYRVDNNDTLATIADYYNVSEEGLRAINHLTAEETVYTGQKLVMPVSPALFDKHTIYKVKANGEYLFDIAYNHKVSIKSILKANYLKNPNIKFEEGTIILISLTEKSKVTWIDYEDGKPVNSWIF